MTCFSVRTRVFVALAATVAIFAASPASAQRASKGTIKIGYVNTERILRDAAPAKASQKRLEREFSKRDRELQTMTSKLKAMSERLERDRSVLSESERRDRRREFADIEKDFQRKQREFREDLSQRRNEELSQVLDQANRAIRDLAKREKYDLILQEVVFAGKRIDITDRVIKALGK